MTTLEAVRDRISQRSEKSRAAYLEEVKGGVGLSLEVADCLQAIKLMLLLPARQEKKTGHECYLAKHWHYHCL